MTMTLLGNDEEAFQRHVAALGARGLAVRSVGHAWTSGGGTLSVGKVAVRLVAVRGGRTFTAATIRSDQGVVEVAKPIIQAQGVGHDAWTHWSDELADLRAFGFDAAAKYPTVRLDGIGDAGLARLVLGVRDLALLLAGR
jgi:hypothetical protein